MPVGFNDAIRRYDASREEAARRIPTRDPAELDPEDVRAAALRAGASREDADAQARAHAARHGDDFNALLSNDLAAAQARRPKL